LHLEELAKSLILSNLEKYMIHQNEKMKGMDLRRWKLCKQHQGVTIYVERSGSTSYCESSVGDKLPLIRGIGNAG